MASRVATVIYWYMCCIFCLFLHKSTKSKHANRVRAMDPVTLFDFRWGRTRFNYDHCFDTLRPRQNGRHFTEGDFKDISLNENLRISIRISLKFIPIGQINNITAMVQIMAWRRSGDKPLSEPVMASLLMQICVTRSHSDKREPLSGCHQGEIIF